MTPDQILKNTRADMEKAVDHVVREMAKLHTGKASPSMVETVHVSPDSYGGTSMPLSNLAAVTTPDPRTITITPWDKAVIKDINKAILAANIGLTPSIDGAIIRISVPELSKDRRKELAKVAHGMAEDGRVRVRAIRREGMDAIKGSEKDNELSEDDLKRYEKEVQSLTDEFVKKIDDLLEHKEQELMAV